MENSMHVNDELLWDYVDGLLSPEAAENLEQLLLNAPVWQHRLTQIRQDKQALANLRLESPGTDLAGNVMAALRRDGLIHPQAKPLKNNTWVLWLAAGVLALLLTACIVMLVVLAGRQPFTITAPAFPVESLLRAIASPAVHYALYLAATYGLWQFLDKFLQQRKAASLIRS